MENRLGSARHYCHAFILPGHSTAARWHQTKEPWQTQPWMAGLALATLPGQKQRPAAQAASLSPCTLIWGVLWHKT